jgi:hypothetical protein
MKECLERRFTGIGEIFMRIGEMLTGIGAKVYLPE